VHKRFLSGDLKERDTWKTWRKREDSIRLDLPEMGWGDLGWIDLAQDKESWQALVNVVINLRVA
jgi:hypothetical protein